MQIGAFSHSGWQLQRPHSCISQAAIRFHWWREFFLAVKGWTVDWQTTSSTLCSPCLQMSSLRDLSKNDHRKWTLIHCSLLKRASWSVIRGACASWYRMNEPSAGAKSEGDWLAELLRDLLLHSGFGSRPRVASVPKKSYLLLRSATTH